MEAERMKKKDGWKTLSEKVLKIIKKCEISLTPMNSQKLSSEELYLKSKNALNSNLSRMKFEKNDQP